MVSADPLIQQNEEVAFNAGRLNRRIVMKLDDYIRIASRDWYQSPNADNVFPL
ncbi:MAG: hypothetical protein IT315_01645 [Anaerolineales bacterium]|nr:hypothetical protein [Anaerolineales bacterium]